MLKDKNIVVNDMRKLISQLNCSDSLCQKCSFKSHCCMCVRALEVLYDNGYRNILTSFNKLKQDTEREIDMRVLEELDQVRKETAREIIEKLIEKGKNIGTDIVLSLVKQLGFIEDNYYEK